MSCNWPVDRTCLPMVHPGETAKEAALQASLDTAVGVLWRLTGRVYGQCAVTARPCPPERDVTVTAFLGAGFGWVPVLDAGTWRNERICQPEGCTSIGPSAAVLPGPVSEIVEVAVDGTVIDPASYRLEGDVLYRAGGHPWPRQDLSRPAGEPGTWIVTYRRGAPPPAGAARMAALLATEFFNACTGGKCRVPRRVQTVTRRGYTFARPDPSEIYDNNATGLTEVDMWINSLNPAGLDQPTLVLSPDYPGGI